MAKARGHGPEQMRTRPAPGPNGVMDRITAEPESFRVVTGSLVLGAAGMLRRRRATTHRNAHDFLARFGAIPVEGRIVRYGTLISAGGATSGVDFGLAVIAELPGQAEAETVQLSLEYAPAPPFQAGTPETAPAAVLAAARERLAPSRRAGGHPRPDQRGAGLIGGPSALSSGCAAPAGNLAR
ncbi:hypothetical protein D2T33_13845 [Sinirhodobacter populi]|uniref:DJ-1/PfpI domain-containing protein n=2 Tax=Paenirhodobacter populi TaxID=2306993 RepID=A0A443IS74_9RHOB|nr:hypothetical protein D2T33_13845 [Sinirhodobacter populi]